jgi:hypothetical protein
MADEHVGQDGEATNQIELLEDDRHTASGAPTHQPSRHLRYLSENHHPASLAVACLEPGDMTDEGTLSGT